MAIVSTFVHTICLITVVLFGLWVVQLASKQKSRHVEIAGHNWANFATFEAQFMLQSGEAKDKGAPALTDFWKQVPLAGISGLELLLDPG